MGSEGRFFIDIFHAETIERMYGKLGNTYSVKCRNVLQIDSLLQASENFENMGNTVMLDSETCELFVVRHGETEANKTGLLQGHLDTPLDEAGRMQASAVAERLKDEMFDGVISSDLGRATETARIILKYHPELHLMTDPDLRERNLGILQGHRYEELMQMYPEIMASFKVDGNDIPVPGGESLSECNERLAAFMERTADGNPGKRILIVTHGGALQCMFRHAVGVTAPGNIRPFSGNAAISVFRRKKKAWQLITWNDCNHLRLVPQKDTLVY